MSDLGHRPPQAKPNSHTSSKANVHSHLKKVQVKRRTAPRIWMALACALPLLIVLASCGKDSGTPTDPSLTLGAPAGGTRAISISPDNTAGDPYDIGAVTAPFSATNTIVQTFKVTNISTKVTSGIAVSLSGTGVAAYSIAPGDDGCTGRSLGTALKNNSCTVKVTFDPSASGTFLATLQITLAQPKGIYTVNLTGTGELFLTVTLRLGSGVSLPTLNGAQVALSDFSASVTNSAGSVKTKAFTDVGNGIFQAKFSPLAPDSYQVNITAPTGMSFTTTPSIPLAVTLTGDHASQSDFTVTAASVP